MNKRMTECINMFSFSTEIETKVCTKCCIEKELSEYGKDKKGKCGLRSRCKECTNKYHKQYQKVYFQIPKNIKRKRKREKEYYRKPEVKEKQNKRSREYYHKPEVKEKLRKRSREHYHKPKVKERVREWQNNRQKTDPIYRIKHSISSGLYKSLKTKNLSKNNRHWEDLLGYNIQEFKDYIAPLFRKKIVNGKEIIMSWNNHGTKWEIDHIYPSSLCGNTEADIIYNYRLENLQPLWKEDNSEKNNRLDWVRDPNKYIKIA